MVNTQQCENEYDAMVGEQAERQRAANSHCPDLAGYLRHELNKAKANCYKWHSEWCDSDGMMDSFAKSNADYWKGRRDALRFLILDNTK